MSKIANKQENYRSRSKNVIRRSGERKEDAGTDKSRKDFVVDANGYFVWNSSLEAKKI